MLAIGAGIMTAIGLAGIELGWVGATGSTQPASVLPARQGRARSRTQPLWTVSPHRGSQRIQRRPGDSLDRDR